MRYRLDFNGTKTYFNTRIELTTAVAGILFDNPKLHTIDFGNIIILK